MQVLYVARMARYDLLRPTCRLACYIAKWSDACDRRLFQLIRYIHSTYHLRQVGWVGDGVVSLPPPPTYMPMPTWPVTPILNDPHQAFT